MANLEYFAQVYREQYGFATDELLDALLKHNEKVALLNPFITKEQLKEIKDQGQEQEILGFSYWLLPHDLAPRLINGLMSHYFLDLSSLLAPLLLPLRPHDRVLDMCSAPGGKLLAMIARLIPEVSYNANDISSARAERLRRVINAYVPEKNISHIKTSVRDASYFALKNPGIFDAVLLDAPCSSEQHIIKNPNLLSKFKGLRKNLLMRQYSLLCSALLATKPGGFIMYATCSINQHENEGMIKKLLKKKSHMCVIQELKTPFGSKSLYGTSILPHVHQAGPAFLSLIRRT